MMKKIILITLICAVSGIILLAFLFAKKDLPQIPVLAYHHIVSKAKDEELANPAIITKAKFRSDMLYLKNKGFNPISFKQYAR